MTSDFKSQIHTELGGLGPEAQQRVLEYVRVLKQIAAGMSADMLKRHVGCIAPRDGEAMREAIESGCEQVNMEEW